MVKFSISIFVGILFFASCGNSPDSKKKGNSAEGSDTIYHILVFKKELKLEIWQAGVQNKFLDSFKIDNPSKLPIGQFDLTFNQTDKSLKIHFPNEFYKRKAFKIDANLSLAIDHLPERFFTKIQNAEIAEILIFPNDNRRHGDLVPCFGCPHWMAEVFAFLNLKKKEYI